MLCGQASTAATHAAMTTDMMNEEMTMSTQSSQAYLYSAEPAAPPVSLTWLKALGRIRLKLRRRRQMQDLIELDDHLLADIGITREQALSAAKAYWV